MADDGGLVLHPREGERLSGTRGDRAIVGVAAIALLGGFLILAGNLVGSLPAGEDASPPASSSASPQRTPRPSATPAPPRTATVVLETPPAVPIPQIMSSSGYVEARSEVAIRSVRRDDAPIVGVLSAGDGAYAEGGGYPSERTTAWLRVYSEHGDGWVAPDADLVTYFDQWAIGSPEIAKITSGPDGFVAQGWGPDPQFGGVWFDLFSPDGLHWSPIEGNASSLWDAGHAFGPAGWLRIGAGERTGGQGAVWVSEMGPEGWQVIGPIVGITPSSYVSSLAASEQGYLFAAENSSRISPGGDSDLWFSSDGLTWHETAPLDELGVVSPVSVSRLADGFYAWTSGAIGPGSSAGSGAFSANGRDWVGVEDAPDGFGLRVAPVGDGLVAIDHDPVGGEPRAWIAEMSDAGLAWQRVDEADRHFAGSAVTALASHRDTAIAFGVEMPAERPLSWHFADGAWGPPDPLPSEIGGIPRIAASGPDGAVILGRVPTLRARSAVFWAERDGRWVPEPDPVLEPVGSPTPDECDALPTNPIGLLFAERGLVVKCIGGADLTVRAWTEPCPGCYPTMPPADPYTWLMGSGPALSLAINHSSALTVGVVGHGVLDPALRYDPGWEGAWVQVTGHFDDPRAAECRQEPSPADIDWYEGRDTLVIGCRLTFVITSVTVLDRPAAP